MTQALMDEYQDTRDLDQEVVDISLTQINAKKYIEVAISEIGKSLDPTNAILQAYDNAILLPGYITKAGSCPTVKAAGLHQIDLGAYRPSISKAIVLLNDAIDNPADPILIAKMNEAHGYLSEAHLGFERLAKENNIRTPFYNGGGGR